MASDLTQGLKRLADCLADDHGVLVRSAPTDPAARRQLEDIALEAVVRQLRLRPAQARDVAGELVRDMVGLGPLEDLLAEPEVTEIMVNGYQQIFVERSGRIQPTELSFRDEDHLRLVIRRMVRPLGRRLDQSSPTVDGRLTDGSRFHAVIPPLVLQGAVLTIRKFPQRRWDAADLAERGTWDEHVQRLLLEAVRRRRNILIAGATGAGKSTVLAALLNSGIGEEERVITIEEAAELRLSHQHLISMEARKENSEGYGEVSIRQLLRNALRMRPDRIIIGEVRGEEAFELLQALNTGHRGSLSTVHANGPLDALHRFENMALMASESLPHHVLRQQIAQAVDLVVHLMRDEQGRRRLNEVAAVDLCPNERTWKLTPLVVWKHGRWVKSTVQPSETPAQVVTGT